VDDLEGDVLEQVVRLNLQHVEARLHLLEQHDVRPVAGLGFNGEFHGVEIRNEPRVQPHELLGDRLVEVEAESQSNQLLPPAVAQ
jgi:hypothetical protein